jgi:hypothetical protein
MEKVLTFRNAISQSTTEQTHYLDLYGAG